MLYVAEKEQALRRLERLLFEERVHSEALSERMAETARLSRVGRAVNATLELPQVLDMILDAAMDLLGGDEASIMLVSQDKASLEVVSYRGEEDVILGSIIPMGSGISGTVAAEKEPKLLGEKLDPGLTGFGHPERLIHSAMSCPLIRRGEPIGVLNITEIKGERTFGGNDLEAAGFFAEHAAIAIGNARLFAKERETITRLEELDRLKQDFLANVSHELRSPLASIIGSARTIKRNGSSLPVEDREHFMDIIDRQGERLLCLIEDLLTTSRVDSGRFKMSRQRIELESFTEEIARDLRISSLAGNRKIVTQYLSDAPIVWGDARAMQHILRNLVENSFKYSDDGTTVTVVIEERSAEVVMEVRDEGRGIPADEIPHIFERFRQVDHSHTRTVGGVGLGLAIVEGLVTAHNGEIEVDSEVGVGSTFRIRLPKRAVDRT
jgi:signal transduction histidine kinase